MYLRQAQQTVSSRLVSSRLVVAQTLMTSLSLIRIPIVAAAVSTGAPLHLAATVPPPRSTCREQQVDNPLENAEGDRLCSLSIDDFQFANSNTSTFNFSKFFRNSSQNWKRIALIIHGRGKREARRRAVDR